VIDNSQHGWPLSRAWNYGVTRLLSEGCDGVVVCNDDIVLRPDTGPQLVEGLRSRPDLLMVTGFHCEQGQERPPSWEEGADFACFCVDTRLFRTVGEFDENFTPCWFEDVDMHHRIRMAGYDAMRYASYHHYLNGTLKHDAERRAVCQARFPGLQRYFIAKWGGLPGEHGTHDIPFRVPFNGGAPMSSEQFMWPEAMRTA
jgi:GT2 family glycosyltransferase